MSSPSKPRYRTTNWKQYNASLQSRGSLTVWLDKRMGWFAAASGKRGHSPKFSAAAIQFCLTLKNLFALALRQTTGLAQSILDLSGRRRMETQKARCKAPPPVAQAAHWYGCTDIADSCDLRDFQ